MNPERKLKLDFRIQMLEESKKKNSFSSTIQIFILLKSPCRIA